MIARALLAAALASLAATLATPDRAAASTPGNRLSVSSHCGSDLGASLSIVEDPSLHQAVDVSGSVASLSGGAGGAVSVSGACNGGAPTAIRIPVGFPVEIVLTDATALSIDTLSGHAAITLAGSGDMRAANLVGGLDLRMVGTSDVAIGTVSGPVDIEDTASGDVAIRRVTSPSFNVRATGSGDVAISDGTIGDLTATTYGSGDLQLGVDAVNVDARSTGSGDINVRRATGRVSESGTGSGDVNVGGAAAVAATAAAAAAAAATVAAVTATTTSSSLQAAASRTDGTLQGLATVVVVLGALALAVWFGVRLIPVLRARVARRGASRVPGAAGLAAGPVDPRLAALVERLSRLAARTNRLEHYVTSREFELNRGFSELAGTAPRPGRGPADQKPV